MEYLNFDLRFERANSKYRARVLDSPGGQASIDFAPPFSELELENFLLKFGRSRPNTRRINSSELETAKAFGSRLFKTVFDDDVFGCFRTSLEIVRQQNCGLRVRLRLSDTPELADLPWEYLYDPNRNLYLACSTETPIVRYLERAEPIYPLVVELPLRILTMISCPFDFPALDAEREWEKLHAALRDLQRQQLVVLERLEDARLATLQRRLRQQDYHIFHFVGHGCFDQQANDGFLILTDEHQRGHAVSAESLGTLLRDKKMLRLVILNSCEGARNSRTDPFAGAAQSLIQQGIPAVLAMQFEVTDNAAIALTEEFYSVFAEGNAVDFALTEARKAISFQSNAIEWGAPVLHMRAPDGKIFDIAALPREKNNHLNAETEPFVQFFNAYFCLSILSHLNELPVTHPGLQIAKIGRDLGFERRKDIVAALSELTKHDLLDKIRKDNNTYWQISEKGRQMVRRLCGLTRTKIAIPTQESLSQGTTSSFTSGARRPQPPLIS